MGRLIDANEFKKQIAGMGFVNNYPADKVNNMCELIDKQKTAYDVDKVIKELEERKQLHNEMISYEHKHGTITEEYQARKAVEVLEKAIEIVKSGGVK